MMTLCFCVPKSMFGTLMIGESSQQLVPLGRTTDCANTKCDQHFRWHLIQTLFYLS